MKAELGPRSGRVYQDLRAMIEDGRLPIGAALPSRQELARHHGVAVMTVGQAVELLEREGMVESHVGSGTFVRSRLPKRVAGTTPLQSVIDASPLAIVTFDPEGVVTSWNHAAERIFGWTAEEAIGRAHPALPPGTEEQYRSLVRRVGSGETVSDIETRRLRKDGRYIHVSLALAPLCDPEGRIVGAVTFAADATIQREQAAAVRQQAELLELAQEAILVRDLRTGRIRYWSAGAETLYGWTRDEAIHDLLQTEFPEPLAEITAMVIESGRWTGELDHITRDGRHIAVESRWALYRDESGEPVGALEVNRDITALRAQAAALHRREASFRAMFDRAGVGMGLASMDGRLRETNAAMQHFLRYSADELRRLSFRDFTHPHDLSADLEVGAELVTGRRESYSLEKRYIRKDGQVVWGHVTASLIRDDEGNPALVAVMIEDITARKLAEADVRAGELRYRDLVESAHDLIFTLDHDGYFTSVNRRTESASGYSRDEAGRLTLMQIVSPDDQVRVKRMIADLSAGGDEVTQEIGLMTKSGKRIPLELTGALIIHEGKPSVRVIAREERDQPAGRSPGS
jgi:PAS domain S-box-containing protein